MKNIIRKVLKISGKIRQEKYLKIDIAPDETCYSKNLSLGKRRRNKGSPQIELPIER